MTAEEGKQELANFERDYKDTYVAVVPGSSVRLASGIVFTVQSTRLVGRALHVAGTIRNAGSARLPTGHYALDLNESYSSQIAYWRTHNQGLGVCASTCVTSHMEARVPLRALAPGQSMPYSVVYPDFTRYQRNHNPADMILMLGFFNW